MSKRENHHKQVVIKNKTSTEVWEKNSVGKTTKDDFSRYNKKTGNTTDSYSILISSGGVSGKKKKM